MSKIEELVRKYVDGWVAGDAGEILSPLTEDCIIVESHGPVYRGTDEIKRWIGNWAGSGSKVDKWDILSFYEIPPNSVVFEWKFECTVSGKKHSLEGISILKLRGGKISYVREYRTSKPASL